MPQVVGNKQKWKEASEGLEISRRLAKHTLSRRSETYKSWQITLNCEQKQLAASCGNLQLFSGLRRLRQDFLDFISRLEGSCPL